MKMPRALTLAVVLAAVVGSQAVAANPPSAPKLKKFALWKFDEINYSCRAKGRLQDKEYCSSQMIDQIIAHGKDAIPVLISQMTETRPTKKPIYDYWRQTTGGDVAYFILHDLFTDSDWKTFTLPGIESPNESCQDSSESCWSSYLKKHGRRFVQKQWQQAWEANKERIYWDQKARCFRLS